MLTPTPNKMNFFTTVPRYTSSCIESDIASVSRKFSRISDPNLFYYTALMVWHFTHPLDTVIEHLAVRLDGTKFSEVIQFGVYDWLETGWFKAILEHIRAASC